MCDINNKQFIHGFCDNCGGIKMSDECQCVLCREERGEVPLLHIPAAEFLIDQVFNLVGESIENYFETDLLNLELLQVLAKCETIILMAKAAGISVHVDDGEVHSCIDELDLFDEEE